MMDHASPLGLSLPALTVSKYFFDNIGFFVQELIEDVKQVCIRQPGIAAPGGPGLGVGALAAQLGTAALAAPFLGKYAIVKASAFSLVKLTCGWLAREMVSRHLQRKQPTGPPSNPVLDAVKLLHADLGQLGSVLWRLEKVPEALQEIIQYLKTPLAVKSEELRLRADASYRAGLKREAVTDLRLAISHEHGDYTNYAAHRMLGHILCFDDKNYPSALDHARQAILHATRASNDPDLPKARRQMARRQAADAHLLAAKIYQRLQGSSLEEIFAECSQAVALDPDSPDAHYNLAKVAAQMGRGAAVAASLEKAIRRSSLCFESADIDPVFRDVAEVTKLLQRRLQKRRARTAKYQENLGEWLRSYQPPDDLAKKLRRAESRLNEAASYTEHRRLHPRVRRLLEQADDLHRSHIHEVRRLVVSGCSPANFLLLEDDWLFVGYATRPVKNQVRAFIVRRNARTMEEQQSYRGQYQAQVAAVGGAAFAGIASSREVTYHHFPSKTTRQITVTFGWEPRALAFLGTGGTVVAIACDNGWFSRNVAGALQVEVWSGFKGQRLAMLESASIRAGTQPLRICGAGDRFVACYSDEELLLWDRKREYGLFSSSKGKLVHRRAHKLRWDAVRFSPDGSLLFIDSQNGEMVLYDTHRLSARHTLRGARAGSWGTCFSPDGRLLATFDRGDSTTLHVWDTATGKELAKHSFPKEDSVSRAAFRPGERLLYVCSRWGEEKRHQIHVFDVTTGKVKQTLPVAGPGLPNSGSGWDFFVFSSDGATAVSKQTNDDQTHWTSWAHGFTPRSSPS